ncbi:hypothetical protein OIV83_006321 [Microbotryomycetes sp. JL201]|nr:hypothetical protein OIV83_006321 [Microbotryomycetes sp. JL201]
MMQRTAVRPLSTSACRAAPSVSTASTASPSSSIAAKVVPRTRPLPVRKQVLYAKHQRLLTNNKVVLFLRPSDFTAHEWRDLRAEIVQAVPASITPSTDASPATTQQLKLTVLRPGLLPALLRDEAVRAQFDSSLLTTHLAGPLAILTAAELHPPTLKKVLKILEKYSTSPARNASPVDPKQVKTKDSAATAAALRLPVLSSLFETQAADHAKTLAVSKMPSLDVLRSQIVGLLSMPGARITGMLGQRAIEVSRTLQGFKQGLEDSQTQASKS